MIYELLTAGKENARTGAELARALNCTARDISRQIETERRAGLPICAATGENPGYYIAADEKELQAYCDSLKSRAIEVFKTRQALVKVLKRAAEKKQAKDET